MSTRAHPQKPSALQHLVPLNLAREVARSPEMTAERENKNPPGFREAGGRSSRDGQFVRHQRYGGQEAILRNCAIFINLETGWDNF